MKRPGAMGLLVGLVGVTLVGLIVVGLANRETQERNSAELVLEQQHRSALPVYDQLGQAFDFPSTHPGQGSLASAQGKVLLLSFGFTHCPDVCPLILNKYAQLFDVFERKGFADQVRLVFITQDPKRDTLNQLRQHLGQFDKRIVGLRPDDQQRAALQDSLAVAMEPGAPMVAHSDRLFILDPQGRVRAMPSVTEPTAQIVGDVTGLLSIPAK